MSFEKGQFAYFRIPKIGWLQCEIMEIDKRGSGVEIRYRTLTGKVRYCNVGLKSLSHTMPEAKGAKRG